MGAESIFIPNDIDKYISPVRYWGERQGFIYLIRSPFGSLYKIGRARNPAKRFVQLQKIIRGEIAFVGCFAVTNSVETEMRLHDQFCEKRKIGEWFALEPSDFKHLATLINAYAKQTDIEIALLG